MAFLEGFVGGAAGAGSDILQEQRRSDTQVAAAQKLADYNNDMAIKREQMIEQLRVESGNRQREAQVSRIGAEAGKIADTAIEGKRGLISSRIATPETWTPEQQAAVDQSLGIERSKVAESPATRTRAAIATGDISPKDAAAMESRSEIAAAKNEAYLQNVQAKLDMAADKLEMAKTIANIRAASGGGSGDKDPANAKMIEYLVKNGTSRERATEMVLGDNTGKTKDPVGLSAQLATALIRDGIRVPPELKAKGATPASYAMDIATQQIEAATSKFRPESKPAAPAPKPAPSPAALPAGARQIGTSGGKPVYETPDGKRFIQK